MTTKRITSLRELLLYRGNQHLAVQRDVLSSWKQETQGISKKLSTRSTEVVV